MLKIRNMENYRILEILVYKIEFYIIIINILVKLRW